MPDMNMQTYEEVQRHQLVTEFDIQSQSELDDYQVKLVDVSNPTQAQDNLVVGADGESLSHWNESVVFDTWVKTNIATSGKRGLLIHGNAGPSSGSSGDDVFIQYRGYSTSNFKLSNVATYPLVFHTKYKYSGTTLEYVGLSDNEIGIGDSAFFQLGTVAQLSATVTNNGSYTPASDAADAPTTNAYDLEFSAAGQIKFYRDDVLHITHTTNIPDANMGIELLSVDVGGIFYYGFIRRYTATEPTILINTPKNISTALKILGRAG